MSYVTKKDLECVLVIESRSRPHVEHAFDTCSDIIVDEIASRQILAGEAVSRNPSNGSILYKENDADRLVVVDEDPKPPGYMVQVCCQQCNFITKMPLGSTDPKEDRCQHIFDFKHERGFAGALVCRGCGLSINRTDLERASIIPYTERANALADKMTGLLENNKELLVENAMLRRQIEKLERKK